MRSSLGWHLASLRKFQISRKFSHYEKGACRPSQELKSRFTRVAKRTYRRSLPKLRRIGRDIFGDRVHQTVFVGSNRILMVTDDGFRIRLVADDLSITPELVHHGGTTMRFSVSWLPPFGQGIGLWMSAPTSDSLALAAGKRVGRWGRVIAIEADPELSELCESNAKMNWLQNVDVIHAAAGAEARDCFARASPGVSRIFRRRLRRAWRSGGFGGLRVSRRPTSSDRWLGPDWRIRESYKD